MKVAGGGLGLCGALAPPSSSGSGLARCASSSRTRRPLWQCRVEQQTLSFHPSSRREFVGGPLSSLTAIPRLRWCSRLRNLPCSSRMRSKQPRRHSLNDGIMRAAAVLVGERRALVFSYGDLHMVLLFMVRFSCVHCRVGGYVDVQLRRCGMDGSDGFNGYFYVCLFCVGFGFQANIVEFYVLLSASSLVSCFQLSSGLRCSASWWFGPEGQLYSEVAAALGVDNVSGMFTAGFADIYAFYAVFLTFVGWFAGPGFLVAGEVAALVVDIGSYVLSGGKRALVCGHVSVDKGCAFSLRGLMLMRSLPCVTTGLGKRALVAETALWAWIAHGAVSGAPGSLTPGVSGHVITSKQLGRADFLGPCPQGHGHNEVHLSAWMDRHPC